jgi:hypothetical protein
MMGCVTAGRIISAEMLASYVAGSVLSRLDMTKVICAIESIIAAITVITVTSPAIKTSSMLATTYVDLLNTHAKQTASYSRSVSGDARIKRKFRMRNMTAGCPLALLRAVPKGARTDAPTLSISTPFLGIPSTPVLSIPEQ